MATIDLGRVSENSFFFADDPIVVTVIPNQFEDGGTFRQVAIKIKVDYVGDKENREYDFFLPAVDNATPVIGDVSSAIRSTLAQWEYDADSIVVGSSVTYPHASFSVTAWEREMDTSGNVINYPSSEQGPYRAYLGGVGEYSRFIHGEAYPQYNSESGRLEYPSGVEFAFTSKPVDEKFQYGQPRCTTSFNGTNVETSVSLATVFPAPYNGLFLFVNRYGVFETISTIGRESLGYEIRAERKSLSQPPSYASNPIAIAHKQGGGAVWQMSSGFVSREWADWYASEFLMARLYWMRHEGFWLPVTVEPDGDTVMVYDRSDPSLIAVNFIVRAAVSGSVR